MATLVHEDPTGTSRLLREDTFPTACRPVRSSLCPHPAPLTPRSPTTELLLASLPVGVHPAHPPYDLPAPAWAPSSLQQALQV